LKIAGYVILKYSDTTMEFLMFRILATFSFAITAGLGFAAEPTVSFPKTTIDIGMVVRDIDDSVAFYTKGIGFQQAEGFQVDSDLAKAAGLTDNKPLDVRVLVLGNDKAATKLKLMQIAGTSPRSGDTAFIHSHTGFRYLTIIVADTSALLSRLKQLGVEPLAKSPVTLPENLVPGMSLTCVKDPDGNIVELIGPTPE
jgi:catechol 2,3-dioxygenase-like lactoylglutathione lyase family enzyme